MKQTKATIAYFAAKLIEVASDHDRFEAAFVDTDLGGSSISIERGLEDLYTDGDPLMGTEAKEADEAWEAAYIAFCKEIENDEALKRSVKAFNAKDEEKQWEGSGPLPVQRRLIDLARKTLAQLYARPKLKAPAA